MVKIKVNKGELHMEIEGRGDEIIAEMIVAIKGFYNALAKNDTEEAETFRRAIFLREDLIFRTNDKSGDDSPRHKK
jgi:hypothetical protein